MHPAPRQEEPRPAAAVERVKLKKAPGTALIYKHLSNAQSPR